MAGKKNRSNARSKAIICFSGLMLALFIGAVIFFFHLSGNNTRVTMPIDKGILDATDFPNGANTIFPYSPEASFYGNAQNDAEFPVLDAQEEANALAPSASGVISDESAHAALLQGYWNTSEYPEKTRARGLVNFTWGRVSIAAEDEATPVFPLSEADVSGLISFQDETGTAPLFDVPIPPENSARLSVLNGLRVNPLLSPSQSRREKLEQATAAEAEKARYKSPPDLRRMLNEDLFSGPGADGEEELPPLLFGELSGEDNEPERWSRPQDTLANLLACALQVTKTHALVPTGRTPALAPGEYTARFNRFRGFALRYADQYKLSPSLVLAIMHTESNFNPLAVSPSRAIGLMQIVPETAGAEAYHFLHGMPGKPTADQLFKPETNIRYGSAYLHLLIWRYFGNISNYNSRILCSIAAYNAGPGAVLRMFHADRDKAAARINAMNSGQVYWSLTRRMPSGETRRYVELVTGRMRQYSGK